MASDIQGGGGDSSLRTGGSSSISIASPDAFGTSVETALNAKPLSGSVSSSFIGPSLSVALR